MPFTQTLGQTVGIQQVGFSFVDPGGSGNLLPGVAPNIQTQALTWPPGASWAFIFLRGFGAAYIDENGNIDDHHLGQLIIEMFFQDSNTAACEFFLRDNSNSEGVNLWADGNVMYFQ